MRHYLTCLALAAGTLIGLWAFASWTATIATLAVQSGRELTDFELLWFPVANFILGWFALLIVLVVGAFLALAARLRARAERAST